MTPRVLAMTSSFTVAGPLSMALAPDVGSYATKCIATSLPQLEEGCSGCAPLSLFVLPKLACS